MEHATYFYPAGTKMSLFKGGFWLETFFYLSIEVNHIFTHESVVDGVLVHVVNERFGSAGMHG